MKLKHIAEMTFVVSHESKRRVMDDVQQKTTELASLGANLMYLQARTEWEDISEEKKLLSVTTLIVGLETAIFLLWQKLPPISSRTS